MTYSTHAFPEWSSIEPDADEVDSKYVQETLDTLYDIFGERQEIDQPEYDTPAFAKPRGADVARTIDEHTPNRRLGEACELVSERSVELAEERECATWIVTPRVVATAVYAEWGPRSLEWAAGQLDDRWTRMELCLLSDNLRKLREVDD